MSSCVFLSVRLRAEREGGEGGKHCIVNAKEAVRNGR